MTSNCLRTRRGMFHRTILGQRYPLTLWRGLWSLAEAMGLEAVGHSWTCYAMQWQWRMRAWSLQWVMGYACSYDKCSQVTVEWVGSNEACLRYYAVAGDKTF